MRTARELWGWAIVVAAGAVLTVALLSGRPWWLLPVAAIGAVVWAVWSPYRCLLLVLFSFPLERFGTIPTPWFNIKPFQLLAALTLFALLVQRGLHRNAARRRFPRDPILACYAAFLVANAVCFAVSGNADDMRAIFHYLMFALIAALIVLLVRTPAQLAGVVRAIVLSGAVAAVLGLLQYAGYLSGMETGIRETGMDYVTGASSALRVTSLFLDPNVFASYLCLTLPLGLACSQAPIRVVERGFVAAGVLAMLVALAFAQSRSGFFGVATGALTLLFAQRRAASVGRALLIFALLLVLGWTALALYGFEWYSPEIFVNRALAFQRGMSDRATAWRQILEAFYDHPVFGVGPAQATNWGAYIPNLRSNWDIANSRIVAHNIFVDVAVGTGLLGLVPFALLIALIIRRAWRNLRDAPPESFVWDAGIFAALASVLVNSQSITTLLYPFLWSLGGLVVARAAMQRAANRALQPAPVTSAMLAEERI